MHQRKVKARLACAWGFAATCFASVACSGTYEDTELASGDFGANTAEENDSQQAEGEVAAVVEAFVPMITCMPSFTSGPVTCVF